LILDRFVVTMYADRSHVRIICEIVNAFNLSNDEYAFLLYIS